MKKLPPKSDHRMALCEKYGLNPSCKRIYRKFTRKFIYQLDHCKTEAARRILLGVSR